MGKVSKARKKKKAGGGLGENKVPKKENQQRSGGKKNWEGDGEKTKLQKKPEIRADQG